MLPRLLPKQLETGTSVHSSGLPVRSHDGGSQSVILIIINGGDCDGACYVHFFFFISTCGPGVSDINLWFG